MPDRGPNFCIETGANNEAYCHGLYILHNLSLNCTQNDEIVGPLHNSVQASEIHLDLASLYYTSMVISNYLHLTAPITDLYGMNQELPNEDDYCPDKM